MKKTEHGVQVIKDGEVILTESTGKIFDSFIKADIIKRDLKRQYPDYEVVIIEL